MGGGGGERKIINDLSVNVCNIIRRVLMIGNFRTCVTVSCGVPVHSTVHTLFPIPRIACPLHTHVSTSLRKLMFASVYVKSARDSKGGAQLNNKPMHIYIHIYTHYTYTSAVGTHLQDYANYAPQQPFGLRRSMLP